MPLKEQLMDAIRKNDNIKVSELLDKMDVSAVNETTDQYGMTALHAACENKNDRAFTLLLAKIGIDVNVKDRKGSTPLQMACWCRNDQAILKLLAIPGIEVNVQNRKGHTPLHLACWWRSNDQAVSKLLAIPGIQVNVQNSEGNTPLHRACDRPGNDQAVTKLLAIPGIQVNVQNKEGSTPLHVAYCGQSAALLLATPGIDVNVKDIYGRTPVMVAAGYHRREEVFKLLLQDPRVDLDIKDNTGSGLEEAESHLDVGKKYLNLIQEERMKRGNVQKKQDKASPEESTGIVIEKIEKINKKIEDSKKRLTDVLEKQKVEREEVLEKQKVEREEFLEKQKMEREELARKHQEEKTEQEKIFTREAEANRQHMTDLTDMRNELARDLEKIHFDEGKSNDANKNDEKLKAACRALMCPICLEYMKPPKKIWMCLRSHAICEACKILLDGKPCPTCTPRRPPSWINLRAYTTEKMAKIVFD